MSSKRRNGLVMSVELAGVHPENELRFAYIISGRRITVRVSDELYQDEFEGRPKRDLMTAILNELQIEQNNILAEYDQKNTPESNPSYTFTTQGLV